MMLGSVTAQVGGIPVIVSRDGGNTTANFPTLNKAITVDRDGNEVKSLFCFGLFGCGASKPDLDLVYGLSLMGDSALMNPDLVAATLQAQAAGAAAYCQENPVDCQCAKSPIWCAVQAGFQPIIDVAGGIGHTIGDITNQLKCGLFASPVDIGGAYDCQTNWTTVGILAAGAVLAATLLFPSGRRR